MKRLLTVLLFLLSFVSISQSFKYDRANIIITFDTAFVTPFPQSWKISKTSVNENPLIINNKQHYIDIVKAGLDKYPAGILKNIKRIYLVNTLTSRGQSIGGTMYDGCIFIKLRGITDYNVEKTIHHEFCHILYEKYESLFPAVKWVENNKLEYSGSGFKSLQNGVCSMEYNYKLFPYGFLYEYAGSSMEEDMASFAELMFNSSNKDYIRNNQLLKNKYLLLVSFYKKIDTNINITL